LKNKKIGPAGGFGKAASDERLVEAGVARNRSIAKPTATNFAKPQWRLQILFSGGVERLVGCTLRCQTASDHGSAIAHNDRASLA
jgi:hypothetical protein